MSTSIHPDTEDFELAEPKAEAMIESLRAFGYDLTTAVADLIDNSVSADAKHVWLQFYWDGEGSWLSIKDDGRGMTECELTNAMRPGSQSPLQPRDPKDLGRFGLGLKTASFSQCRRLTVRSKTCSTEPVTRCWDLDYVSAHNEWRLLKHCASSSETALATLQEVESGTVVLWEAMDRLVSGTKAADQASENRFLERVEQVRDHLAMVFHRFIDRPNGLKVFVNERQVKPWDPFLTKEPSTQLLAEEALHVFGQKLPVKPYVLPHHSNITPQTHSLAAGPRGWNAQQGFYVYRNGRLLVDGDWLGLGFQKEEHFKLARIAVDIPNSMDGEWDIDVKKSRARPPSKLRSDLKRIAKITRSRASDVYRHRGKTLARANSADYVFAWEKKLQNGLVSYAINREHPLVKELLQCTEQRRPLSALLRLLEETVPVPLIMITGNENPDKHSGPFEARPTKEVREVMTEVYQALLNQGYCPDEAKARLSVMEPLDRYPELIAGIDETTQEDAK